MALTQKDLNAAMCMSPTCDHKSHSHGLVISGMCHIGEPTTATYKDGIITFLCGVCQKLVVEIKVAAA